MARRPAAKFSRFGILAISIIELGMILAFPVTMRGQIEAVSDQTSTPTPGAGHDYIHLLSETVNPANGTLSINIGTPVPAGRRMTLPFGFSYNSGSVNHLHDNGGGVLNWVD